MDFWSCGRVPSNSHGKVSLEHFPTVGVPRQFAHLILCFFNIVISLVSRTSHWNASIVRIYFHDLPDAITVIVIRATEAHRWNYRWTAITFDRERGINWICTGIRLGSRHSTIHNWNIQLARDISLHRPMLSSGDEIHSFAPSSGFNNKKTSYRYRLEARAFHTELGQTLRESRRTAGQGANQGWIHARTKSYPGASFAAIVLRKSLNVDKIVHVVLPDSYIKLSGCRRRQKQKNTCKLELKFPHLHTFLVYTT